MGTLKKYKFLLPAVLLVISLLSVACTSRSNLRMIKLEDSSPYKGISIIPETTNVSEIQGNKVYTFGFDRRLQPKEDIKMYVPLLKYLEQETGLKFKIQMPSKETPLAQQMIEGKIDFAAMGAMTYLQAEEIAPVKILVKGNNEHSGYYQAVIITRPDSQIQNLQQLKGHSFAFGGQSSTQGYLIPQIMLRQAGIKLGDLSRYTFLSSHAEVANAVLKGEFDTGGLQDTLARSLAAKGLVKIIAVSEYYPTSGIVVSPNVPEEDAKKVQRALLIFDPQGKNQSGLYNWSLSEMPLGFVETSDDEYNTLQREYNEYVRR